MSKTDDPRLGDLMTTGDAGQLVLLGYPHDEGVARNGGRVGAAGAPAAVRKTLPRIGTLYNPELDVDLRTLTVTDGGDVAVGASLEDAHAALEKRVAELVAQDKVPFVIGGGNDQSIANARGLLSAKSDGRVGAINVDAHLDVRPLLDGDRVSGPTHFESDY
eukprot:TRINITY_DN184_c0_g13_i2.p2 TRINITY_DN184_c0_g13~~TRINITY_DN184_c0_g13_i2.p2  ORF type:complete len:169 (+),score=48.58 TRINITY_DN184_c0_g13_i2:22-507(+)